MLKDNGLKLKDIDLLELSEAFCRPDLFGPEKMCGAYRKAEPFRGRFGLWTSAGGSRKPHYCHPGSWFGTGRAAPGAGCDRVRRRRSFGLADRTPQAVRR